MATIVRAVDKNFNPVDLHRMNPSRYPHLGSNGKLTVPAAVSPSGNDFLATFDNWWEKHRTAVSEKGGTPFTGGWFVYLGYELVAQIETCLHLPSADDLLPTAIATRFMTAVIIDHETGLTRIIGEAGQDETVAAIAADIHALPPAGATCR
jgi:anthranilate synthase component 1